MLIPDHERLDRAATLIYGPAWAAPLARDLGTAVRTVDRWRTGRQPIPAGIFGEIAAIATALAAAVRPEARRADLRAAAAIAAGPEGEEAANKRPTG